MFANFLDLFVNTLKLTTSNELLQVQFWFLILFLIFYLFRKLILQ